MLHINNKRISLHILLWNLFARQTFPNYMAFCMQDTFARATHSAYAAGRPSAARDDRVSFIQHGVQTPLSDIVFLFLIAIITGCYILTIKEYPCTLHSLHTTQVWGRKNSLANVNCCNHKNARRGTNSQHDEKKLVCTM